jgi:hypothetical protein
MGFKLCTMLKLSRKSQLSEEQCTFPVCLEVLNNLTLKDVRMFINELKNKKPVCQCQVLLVVCGGDNLCRCSGGVLPWC